MKWSDIIRVRFESGDLYESDTVYLFTRDLVESYMIPGEASGRGELWSEIIER